jgi:ectoine hydroxylase-related dioxygenase (phytanoyl-CoA dioxygenase family)
MGFSDEIERDGFAIIPELLTSSEIQLIAAELDSCATDQDGLRGGTRDVLERAPALRDLAEHAAIRNAVGEVLGDGAFVVRATLFDKTPDANWKVPWHQDVTIAVKERREATGYAPWSMKAGVVHVQPPSAVLERMLTVRIHIDSCEATNGALRVMPGTHRLGRLDQNIVDRHIDEESEVCCEAEAGDALVMRPLLLHASSASLHPQHRRVLHFDYAVGDLAEGLQWKMRD